MIEGVDHHVAVVHQHPLPARVAFDCSRTDALCRETLVDVLRDGAYLGIRSSGTDQEVVRYRRQFRDVEQLEIVGFPVESKASAEQSSFETACRGQPMDSPLR